jgi:LysR family transcriptional regulator, transcriptional activator for dmlA
MAMSDAISPLDLKFFSALVAAGSLGAAARELQISTPAVSKRLRQMEARLGVSLLNRTTRRMSLTVEGATYLSNARRILGEIEELERLLGNAKTVPTGQLRVNATLGFGRSHIGAIVSRFVQKYPRVDVQLHLSVDPPPLSEDAFDVCIRFGEPPDARVIARRVAHNQRLLCASPTYLAKHGTPKNASDLAQHNFISIRQGNDAYGLLRLSRSRIAPFETIKTRGNLTTNDGGIAVDWAVAGHGILLRAEWDVRKYLTSGRLVQVLPNYRTPNADIYAVYPPRHETTARVRVFIEFLTASLSALARG